MDYTKYVLKSQEELEGMLAGKDNLFVVACNKCFKEFNTTEEPECDSFAAIAEEQGKHITGTVKVDFLCNKVQTEKKLAGIVPEGTENVVVISCGLGVQTVADLESVPVFTATNSLNYTGHHGMALTKKTCGACAQCYLNVTGAIQNSCNIFFYSAGHDLGIDKLDKYAALFGLGESTGIELPESTGNMANAKNHEELTGEPWTIGQTMQAAIGQSDSLFTPLQIAEYCAAVANGGERHSASILKSVRSYSYGDNVHEREDEVLSKVETAQYNWDAVHEGMRLVGKSSLPNYTMTSIAAKTGTAQKGESIANDGIFICYAPFDDPEIAMAIVVQKGGAGANCSVIAQEILEAYFSLKSATDVTDVEGELLQ